MRRDTADNIKAAVIEPVGGHGGMDYYDSGLCEGLAAVGVDVTLYTCDETPPGTYGKIRFPYRRIYGEGPAWRRGLRYVRGSLRALLSARLGRAWIAHFHLFHVGPLELFNVLAARLLGLKVVVTAHDVQSFVERLSVPWMVRWAYRASERIIVQSRVGERELRTALGQPASTVDVIPHGNYLGLVGELPPRAEARDRLGLPREGPVLLFFGQIKAVKGLDVLLRAMPKLLATRPNTVLLVAGKVWKDDFGRYEKQISALGIADNCVLRIRYIPDDEVPYYYAAADAVVLPYRKIYQSGVLLMAMSYGRPVVVSDIEGMTEVISDDDNGYTFPSEDAESLADVLDGALSDTDTLRSVGEEGLRYVRENHDWKRIGRMTADCYERALEA